MSTHSTEATEATEIVGALLRDALRAYQDAATEATIAFYRDPEPACDAHLKRAEMLDDAADEIREALALYMLRDRDPADLIRNAAPSSSSRREWLRRVADDIDARLSGEDPPLPEVP